MCLLQELKFIPLLNFENDKEIGTLMIVLDANALLGSPDKAMRPSGSKIYMVDRNGNVFFTNDDSVKPRKRLFRHFVFEKDRSISFRKARFLISGGKSFISCRRVSF